jgi:hypothetical protein
MNNEYSTGISFEPENSKTIERRPQFSLTYFRSEVGEFTPLFTMGRREEWKYASLERCEFNKGTVSLIPGGSLASVKKDYSDFVITGEVKRHKGKGPAIISISTDKNDIYQAVCGEKCGLVYRKTGTTFSRKLWVTDKYIDLSEWTRFTIAVRGDTVHFRIGPLYSGPIKGISFTAGCIISIAAEDCYAGFRDLLAGKKR